MGRLSTHVLDTSRGRAAAGMRVELWRFEEGERMHCVTLYTNADGRTDEPLLIPDGGQIASAGITSSTSAAGDYFRDLGRGVAASAVSRRNRDPHRRLRRNGELSRPAAGLAVRLQHVQRHLMAP